MIGRTGAALGALAAAALVTAAAPAAAAPRLLAFEVGAAEGELSALVNEDRLSAGLPALLPQATLTRIGRAAPYEGCGFPINGRAFDMVARQYFAHAILGCRGQNVFNLMDAYRLAYAAAAENIGWNNYADAESVSQIHRAFMESPAHRANILNPRFTHLAVGAWAAAEPWTYAGSATCPCTGVKVYTELFISAPGNALDAPQGDSTQRVARPAGRGTAGRSGGFSRRMPGR